jgi:hypothetical protein
LAHFAHRVVDPWSVHSKCGLMGLWRYHQGQQS